MSASRSYSTPPRTRRDGRGRVGSDEPLVAFDDAVREFEPGHILIALRPEERAGWQERGLIDAVLGRFGLPLTVFVLTGD